MADGVSVVLVVCQGSRETSWVVGRWRAAKRQIKYLASAEMGFQYGLRKSISESAFLLDKGLGVVGTKRGVTAEENVRDNGCTERESNEPAFRLCMRVEVIILVNQMSMGFPWPVFLMTSGAT